MLQPIELRTKSICAKIFCKCQNDDWHQDGYLTVTAPRDQVAIKARSRGALDTADKTGQVRQTQGGPGHFRQDRTGKFRLWPSKAGLGWPWSL